VAHFAAGTVATGAFISQIGDGTLSLSPALEETFSGSSLPTGWSAPAWGAGGTSAVTNGTLLVNGVRAGTNATYTYTRSIEFEATFANVAWQHVGLVADWDFNDAWAIFSTYAGDSNLYARTGFGQSTSLGSSFIGTPHRYRIEALAISTRFYVDGNLVATHNALNGNPLRPLVSDATVDGIALPVDWIRLSPNAASGVFTSRIYDATEMKSWDEINWNSLVPANTTLNVQVRSGQTASPDETWNDWAAVTSGSSVGQLGRYVQYEVTLGTSDSGVTPMFYDISFECSVPAQINSSITISTPTAGPTQELPTGRITPTEPPTLTPTYTETPLPTDEPTAAPTDEPTAAPTDEPTVAPTETPTATLAPTEAPTDVPTATLVPTETPTEEPPPSVVEESVTEEAASE
jgi:hypothetical protein